MPVYYASIGYTTEPGKKQIIPVGGNHELKFPRNEQKDPWGMHPTAGGVIRIPFTGVAHIQLDVHWANGTATRRQYITGDQQAYEAEAHSTLLDVTQTHLTPVRDTELLGILVGHDAATPQEIVAARIQIAINTDVATPPVRPLRVRVGTDPWIPDDPEAPGQPGGTTPPVNDDDKRPGQSG